VNARGASFAGWRDRWQIMDNDAPLERSGPLLGGLAALAEKEEGEQYEADWKQYMATGQVLYEKEPPARSARAKMAQILDDKAGT
jgi:hypothetical protein